MLNPEDDEYCKEIARYPDFGHRRKYQAKKSVLHRCFTILNSRKSDGKHCRMYKN